MREWALNQSSNAKQQPRSYSGRREGNQNHSAGTFLPPQEPGAAWVLEGNPPLDSVIVETRGASS